MHISPGTTDAQDMQHTIEKTDVYLRTDAKASNCWSRQARELQVCDGVAKRCGDMACPVSVAVRHAFVTVALNQGLEHEAVQGLDVDMTLFTRFDRGFLESGVGKTSDIKCSDNPLAFEQLGGPVLLAPRQLTPSGCRSSCRRIVGILGRFCAGHAINSEIRRNHHWSKTAT
ncbi:hypothetical protein A0U94_01725 [Gluconobacter albidus]|nr:hypothetical protein A0U94_01725 [Gluconobacter albidus]